MAHCNLLSSSPSPLRGDHVKKWIFLLVGAFICLFGYVFSVLNSASSYTTYEVIAANWDIELPQGAEITDIIVKEPSFHGDGEEFTKFQYEQPVDMSEVGLTELAVEDVAAANGKITEFITATISIRNHDKAIINAFRIHNIKAEAGDYYRFVSREGAHDYLILLYKAETNALYLYVWNI